MLLLRNQSLNGHSVNDQAAPSNLAIKNHNHESKVVGSIPINNNLLKNHNFLLNLQQFKHFSIKIQAKSSRNSNVNKIQHPNPRALHNPQPQ